MEHIVIGKTNGDVQKMKRLKILLCRHPDGAILFLMEKASPFCSNVCKVRKSTIDGLDTGFRRYDGKNDFNHRLRCITQSFADAPPPDKHTQITSDKLQLQKGGLLTKRFSRATCS